MIYCPFCNNSNRNGSKFCNECGASLGEEGLVCPECAARNPTLNRFCHACGQALEGSRVRGQGAGGKELPSWLEIAEGEPIEAEPPPFPEPPQPAPSRLPLPEWLWLEEPERLLSAWLEFPEPIPPPADLSSRQAVSEPAPQAALPSWLGTAEQLPPEAEPPPTVEPSRPAPSHLALPAWLWLEEPSYLPEKVLPAWLGLSDELSRQDIVQTAATKDDIAPRPSPLAPCPPPERALPSWLLAGEEPQPAARPAAAIPSWLFLEEPAEALPVSERGAVVAPGARPARAIALARPFELPQPLRRRAAEPAPAPDYGAVFSAILQSKTELTTDVVPSTVRRLRLVSLLLIAVISLPLLVPMGMNVEPKRGASDVFVAVEALPPAANVLVAFDWSPGSDEEMAPIAGAIIRHLVQRKAEIVAVSLTPEGGKLAQRIVDRSVLGMKGYEYGKQVANLGYLPGGEAAIRAMMTDLPGSYGVDHLGNSARDLPLIRDVRSLKSADLLVILASEPEMLIRWVAQVSSTHQGTRMVAGVSFAALPWARPFAAAGGPGETPQLKGTLAGIRGAAEYELLANQPRIAVAALDAQSLGSVFLVLVVIFGNLAYLGGNLRGKKKRAGPARRAQPDSARS